MLGAGNPPSWFSITRQADISSEWKREQAIAFLLQTETSTEYSEHYGEILFIDVRSESKASVV